VVEFYAAWHPFRKRPESRVRKRSGDSLGAEELPRFRTWKGEAGVPVIAGWPSGIGSERHCSKKTFDRLHARLRLREANSCVPWGW
jgi:hypothetical protein